MKYYDTLFLILYNFLNAIDAGLAYQTKNNRAWAAILIITCFQMLNILSIAPKPPAVIFWITAAIFLGINFVAFLRRGRFLELLKKFNKTPPKFLFKLIVYGYIIGSIVLFICTR